MPLHRTRLHSALDGTCELAKQCAGLLGQAEQPMPVYQAARNVKHADAQAAYLEQIQP